MAGEKTTRSISIVSAQYLAGPGPASHTMIII